jgi:hypothetical protein
MNAHAPTENTDEPKADVPKQSYVKFRRAMVDFITTELHGPTDEQEIIAEGPIARYSSGVLFPQANGGITVKEEIGEEAADLSEEIAGVEYSASYYPSAMGLSFLLPADKADFTVKVSAAAYEKLTREDAVNVSIPYASQEAELADSYVAEFVEQRDGRLYLKAPIDKTQYDNMKTRTPNNPKLRSALYRLYKAYRDGWKRRPVESEIRVASTALSLDQRIEDSKLALRMHSKLYKDKNVRLCTLSLINTETVPSDRQNIDDDKTYFQPKLVVWTDMSKLLSLDAQGFTNDELDDDEEKSLKLLYRENHHYAVGHGVSVDWDDNATASEAVDRVETTYIPHYEIPGVSFEIEGAKDMDLSMEYLATADLSRLKDNLSKLSGAYRTWIESRRAEARALPESVRQTALKHLDECAKSLYRIEQGIALLGSDENALDCFQLANRAMLMQREQTTGKKKGHAWRPFQLAFILQSLASVNDQDDAFRDVVDLIWFPTGGGKTEAYLGLTAYSIFLRRLKNNDAVSGGTTVIMRYTLRLLTAQQFQRACTLICAGELIRRERGDLGSEEISVGLWLGGDTTPNSRSDAKIALRNLTAGRGRNKFQVLSCPWCRSSLADHKRKAYNYRSYKDPVTKKEKILIYCSNDACPFLNGLPISVVDEDIYEKPPTLLFGTVDKFARLPWSGKVSSIFAADANDHHLPPELIIQDELHLISGSLGTMVGLYETAIDNLCTRDGKRPKIIASTATIRRAKDQARQLYAREVRQFPAQGIRYTDSYFSRIMPVSDDNPGRLYIGLMPGGKSSTTFQVRLMAAALQGVDFLPGPVMVKDQYWTFVTYCNSIRELGSSNSIVLDDVVEYSGDIAERLSGGRMRHFSSNVEELTSRKDSEEIPEILQKLEQSYTGKENNYPVSVLLATSMISVGVDIDRLGMMMVLGQPKTTSEYIQASSRVGRKNPGLVLTQFSPSKSRDRSHFEKFKEYHQSIYRWVEPTSVTPFSEPALDRALHAVLVSLMRHKAGVNSPQEIKELAQDDARLDSLKREILERVNYVDQDEAAQTERQLDKIISLLKVLAADPKGVVFSASERKGEELVLLSQYNENPGNESFQTANSMRSTDSQARLEVSYDELPEN